MPNSLIERCEIALQAYENAAAVVAQRAQENYKPQVSSPAQLLDEAGRLAMPAEAGSRKVDLPVLQSLMGHLHQAKLDGYYVPQLLDSTHDVVMPAKTRPADLAARYTMQWKALRDEIKRLPANASLPVREAAYLGLLHRYAWSMAAPNGGDTDVSLYDYTRVQAALAVCLADQPAETDDAALLIGGDVSGVQNWLYTIGSEGAAKSLRGRSVYLQLLSEVVALWLIDKLALPSCNLLYVGGGNFYLLAPVGAAAQLDDLQVEITRRLLKMHNGALAVVVGSTKLTKTELQDQQIREAWSKVNVDIGRRKQQRFVELPDDAEMAAAIGSALAGSGKLEDSCLVCRRPIASEEDARKVEDNRRVCELCCSFEELGNQLRDAEFMVVSRLQETEADSVMEWNAGLRQFFGYDVQFLPYDQTGERSWQRQPSDFVRIYFWQQKQPTLIEFPGNPDPASTIWLYRPLAQAAPEKAGRIATIDELQTEGIDRWGVLRMDVDRLGAIFQEGIPATNLSRVVGLSAMLRLFFEGYAPRLAMEMNEAAPNVYLMYAGGDDLFIVGGWSHLPELAWQVRKALVEFAVGNPNVTISGGISLALSKRYPIYQAASDAGKAESMAKRAGRNSIAFLGQAVKWESEEEPNFIQVRHRVNEIAGWLMKERLNRSFLMRLREIDAEVQQWQRTETAEHLARYKHGKLAKQTLYLGPWLWHLYYSLTRATDRIKDESTKLSVNRYLRDLMPLEIKVLGLETRWAELLTRKKEDTTNV